jgi:hypothetical protein
VDITRFISCSTTPIINGLSEHDAQYLMINSIVAAGNLIYLKQRTRRINNVTIMQFPLFLKSETVYKDDDTNNKFNSFCSLF